MRIAVVCSDLGVRIPGDKGASVHLAAIAAALSRVGNEVALVGVAGRGAPPAGVKILLFPDPDPDHAQGLRRELQRLSFVERMAREARTPLLDFAPDVVYERLSLFGTAGTRLAAATGASHMLEVNALLAEEHARWRGLRLGRTARRRERRVVRAAALRVAVSEELAARVRPIAAGGDTVVVTNGVDAAAYAHLPERREARDRVGLPSDAITLGFLGALRPWHGLEYAIEALSQLPDVLLAVAGDGELRPQLESRARELAVAERVRWLGQLPPTEVPGFLAALDVGLIPYPELPDFAFSPLKLYEYLAAGVPIVASDIGQVGDVLRAAGCGSLVRPGDPAALAEGIKAVLDHPERSRVLAMEGRRRALAEHSWDERARRLTRLLSDRLAHALAA
jgi:glycosyltransferase involved in cell wall biosynthesis